MSVQLSPRYSHVTLFSGYPFLTAVNNDHYMDVLSKHRLYTLWTLLVNVTFHIR